MNQPKRGMPVYTIDNHPVGELLHVYACCIEIREGSGRTNVTPAAIFNVDDLRVTLICESEWGTRYSCDHHVPAPALA